MTRSHVLPRDAAAIAGMGQTEFSRDAGRTELQLASEAIVAACADAQIDVGEVDGLVSYTIDPSRRPSSSARSGSRRSATRRACPTAAAARSAC